ncbi:MAG: NAD(P)-dependent alcohol dehydrogenase [Planctomycetes bacterium]|nr:NAD(P)-dependent alcohol dehydrogenase [Planctomycetota bacterium]
MKSYRIDRFGLAALEQSEGSEFEPGPGQVVVGVEAVSLNYRDLLMVRGEYNPRLRLPLVPCSDGAGTILRVGEGVEDAEVGQRVAGCFAQGWLGGEPPAGVHALTLGGPRDGMLAEEVLLESAGVVPLPAHLSPGEAACLPCAGVTAWSALHKGGGLRSGEWVLIQGTGGVSTFALQLAKLAGARIIVTSRSEAKLERARALGADETILIPATPRWGKAARELSEGGVHLVVEVGGAETWGESLSACRTGARVAVIGVLSGREAKIDFAPVLMRQLRLQGVFVGSRADFMALNAAVEAYELRPLVDRTFAFGAAREAFEALERAEHQGKLVIDVRP